MNLYLWPMAIFLTAVTVLLGVGWWMTRGDQKIPLARLADPEPLPGEWARQEAIAAEWHARKQAGRSDLEATYGPFPADTGPLPLLSESAAAWDALEREQRGWSA